VCGRAVRDVSGFAFERAAVAFTANGQSLIVDDVATNSTAAVTDVGAEVLESAAGCEAAFADELAADLAPCLAQQS
jgi:hypothetical protein